MSSSSKILVGVTRRKIPLYIKLTVFKHFMKRERERERERDLIIVGRIGSPITADEKFSARFPAELRMRKVRVNGEAGVGNLSLARKFATLRNALTRRTRERSAEVDDE